MVAAVDRTAAQGRGRGRGRGPGRGPRGGPRGVSLRRTTLIAPKDWWPPMPPGVGPVHSMELLPGEVSSVGDVPSGVARVFSFVHDTAYYHLEDLYDEAVASMDPNNFMHVLRQHPFHVDSLLALSKVHRAHGEGESALDMLERAIYAMECAAHAMFDLANGRSRIDGRRDVNRPFFQAVHQYASAISRKGCHRSALEICKVGLRGEREE